MDQKIPGLVLPGFRKMCSIENAVKPLLVATSPNDLSLYHPQYPALTNSGRDALKCSLLKELDFPDISFPLGYTHPGDTLTSSVFIDPPCHCSLERFLVWIQLWLLSDEDLQFYHKPTFQQTDTGFPTRKSCTCALRRETNGLVSVKKRQREDASHASESRNASIHTSSTVIYCGSCSKNNSFPDLFISLVSQRASLLEALYQIRSCYNDSEAQEIKDCVLWVHRHKLLTE